MVERMADRLFEAMSRPTLDAETRALVAPRTPSQRAQAGSRHPDRRSPASRDRRGSANAAGERDDFRLALVAKGFEAHQRSRLRVERGAAHRLEQAIGHALDHPIQASGVGLAPDLQREIRFLWRTGAPLPRYGFTRPSASKATMRAPTSSAVSSANSRRHRTPRSSRCRPRCPRSSTRADSRIERAQAPEAVGRERRLERVSRAQRHELARLRREQLADRAGVRAPHRDPGEDQRPGIDRPRVDLRQPILLLDEGTERDGIDRVASAGIRSQKNVGLVQEPVRSATT